MIKPFEVSFGDISRQNDQPNIYVMNGSSLIMLDFIPIYRHITSYNYIHNITNIGM